MNGPSVPPAGQPRLGQWPAHVLEPLGPPPLEVLPDLQVPPHHGVVHRVGDTPVKQQPLAVAAQDGLGVDHVVVEKVHRAAERLGLVRVLHVHVAAPGLGQPHLGVLQQVVADVVLVAHLHPEHYVRIGEVLAQRHPLGVERRVEQPQPGVRRPAYRHAVGLALPVRLPAVTHLGIV